MTKRTSSAKLLFYDIGGEGAKVQIMADLGCGSWLDQALAVTVHTIAQATLHSLVGGGL